MKPTTLKSIQKQLNDFLPVIDALKKSFNRINLTTAKVIVNNMASDSTNTVGYNHENKVQELYDYYNCLVEMHNFDKHDHFIQYIKEEVGYIIDGNAMSEED